MYAEYNKLLDKFEALADEHRELKQKYQDLESLVGSIDMDPYDPLNIIHIIDEQRKHNG